MVTKDPYLIWPPPTLSRRQTATSNSKQNVCHLCNLCNYWDFMLFTQQKHCIFFLFVTVMSLKLHTFYMAVQSRTFKPVMNIDLNSNCICPCHALFLFWIFQCFYIIGFSSCLKVSHFECLYACVCACAGMCMYIPGKARRQIVAVSQVKFTLLF